MRIIICIMSLLFLSGCCECIDYKDDYKDDYEDESFEYSTGWAGHPEDQYVIIERNKRKKKVD